MRKLAFFITMLGFITLTPNPVYTSSPFPIDAFAYAGPDDNICEGESFDILLAAALNYSALLWTSSGSGTFNDPTLIHPTYTPGMGEIGPVTLTLVAYAIPPGIHDTDVMILDIYDGPEAYFTMNPEDSICVGEEIAFYGTSANPIISWDWDFGDPASGLLNHSTLQNPVHTFMTPGYYDVSLIVLDINGCSDTVTHAINVFELPSCDFTTNPSDTSCVGTMITFSGTGTTAITNWDWDFGDGNTASGQIVNHTYVAPGAYVTSLIVTNTNGCSDTMMKNVIVVDCLIDFIMNPNPSCENYLVSFTGIGGSGPYDYEWNFGDGNTATGQNVTHTYTSIGYHTVELTFGPEVVQHSLDVLEMPWAYAGVDSLCCDGSYWLIGAVTYNNVFREWTSSGDGSFDNPNVEMATYYPGPGDIANGSATLTLTAYGIAPCASVSDEMILTIVEGPIADAGPDTASCDGTPITLNGYLENQVSNTWTSAGDGTFDDPTLLDATYTAGSNDLANGSVMLTLSAVSGSICPDATDELVLSLPLQPNVDGGDDGTTCGNVAYTLSGSATNYSSIVWTSSGDGSFDDPSLLDATYAPGTGDIFNGNVALTITAAATQPCTDATDEMLLNILASPIVNAGDDDGICQGGDYTLYGTASFYNEISWSTSGDGSFDDPNILDPTYIPGPTDISNREATLTLSASAIAPCTIGMIDAMQLGIDPEVGNPTTPVGPTTIDSYLNPTSEYEIEATPEANGYKWSISPSPAGDIDGTGITGLVTWNTSFHGLAFVRVTAYNSCSEISSDSLEIEVTTSVGIVSHNTKELEVRIMPNPSLGTFKVAIKGIKQELELRIYNCYGNIVERSSIGTTGKHEQYFNLNHLPRGVYFMNISGGGVNQNEKIIIQ